MNGAAAMQQAPTSAWSMYRAIVGVGIVCALVIVVVYETTAERIHDNQVRFLAAAVAQVLPAAQTTIGVTLNEAGELSDTDAPQALPVFLGYDAGGELVGAVVTAEGMGYQDTIRVLWAYAFDQQAIVGFKVLDSKETPGLGDRVEKEPHFLASFERLSARLNDAADGLLHAIVTVKQGKKTDPWQIDGITGATITSEAIGTIVNESASAWLPVLERDARAFGPAEEREVP